MTKKTGSNIPIPKGGTGQGAQNWHEKVRTAKQDKEPLRKKKRGEESKPKEARNASDRRDTEFILKIKL